MLPLHELRRAWGYLRPALILRGGEGGLDARLGSPESPPIAGSDPCGSGAVATFCGCRGYRTKREQRAAGRGTRASRWPAPGRRGPPCAGSEVGPLNPSPTGPIGAGGALVVRQQGGGRGGRPASASGRLRNPAVRQRIAAGRPGAARRQRSGPRGRSSEMRASTAEPTSSESSSGRLGVRTRRAKSAALSPPRAMATTKELPSAPSAARSSARPPRGPSCAHRSAPRRDTAAVKPRDASYGWIAPSAFGDSRAAALRYRPKSDSDAHLASGVEAGPAGAS